MRAKNESGNVKVGDRLAEHKHNAVSQMPAAVLPLSIELGASFDRAALAVLIGWQPRDPIACFTRSTDCGSQERFARS